MARIRTIKPEFPQSESMGRVSRDARLLFVMLWTLADDAGRARANSRMLASLLFPYDDDAPRLICEWLFELEREGCIKLYTADGNAYLQIEKWLSHQKIDKPSPSRLPECSRELAKVREVSSGDLVPGPRTGTQTTSLRSASAPQAALPKEQVVEPNKVIEAKGTRWPTDARIPSDWFEDAEAQCRTDGFPIPDLRREAGKFERYWSSKAGKDGRKADWRKTWINWVVKAAEDGQNKRPNGAKESSHEQTERIARELARESESRDQSADFGPDRRARIALPRVLADDG